MKIQLMNQNLISNFKCLAEKNMFGEKTGSRKVVQADSGYAANLTISTEGREALREKLKELDLTAEYIDTEEMPFENTNEIAMEHYTAMREITSLTLKDGTYSAEDLAKSMMDAYKTVYRDIVKQHEDGNRQVTYSLTGSRSLTLEEDLAGLEEAFQMRLNNLEGFLTCQQTNKEFGHSVDNFLDNRPQIDTGKLNNEQLVKPEIQENVVSKLQQAREEFLASVKMANSKNGAFRANAFGYLS